MSSYPLGPLQVRPNEGRTFIEGHDHRKAHVTFMRRGIALVQQLHPVTFEVLRQTQIISEEYKETRRLLELYEPHRIKRPYRVPGARPKSPWGEVVLLGASDAIPGDAVPIPIVAQKYWALIHAGVFHSLFALTEDAAWDCAFAHWTEDGQPSQEPTGYEDWYA